ncbi:hypothetical protein JVU11DRAFT_6910 [Chiua virens]|nr:hypothetical protein JVU11DRAFT_6910 [Chiua virens]
MAATSQPIACHDHNDSNHYFLGSWRPGSFGSRFYPGCSPGQLLGPLDDFKCAKLSSSLESDRGSILNALSTFDREDELVRIPIASQPARSYPRYQCRNYSCCGLEIEDLHGLVQHFEEVHVVVLDQFGRPHQQFPVAAFPATRQPLRPQPPTYVPDPNLPLPPAYHHGGFDPDDMELDVDHSSSPSSGGPSPPDTPLTTPLSSHPTHSFNHYSQSTKDPSPRSPVSAFDTTTVLPTRSIHGHSIAPFPSSRNSVPNLTKNPDPFNGYAGYSDYSSSMPGTVPSPPATDDIQGPVSPVSEPNSPYGCLPPAVVFSTANTPTNTPATSRVPSPSNAPRHSTASIASQSFDAPVSGKASSSQHSGSRASTTLSRPASSSAAFKAFPAVQNPIAIRATSRQMGSSTT